MQAILSVMSLLSQVGIQLGDLLLSLTLKGRGGGFNGSYPCLQFAPETWIPLVPPPIEEQQ